MWCGFCVPLAKLRSNSQPWGFMRQHATAIGPAGLVVIAQGLFGQAIINLNPYPDEKSDPSEVLEVGDLALENAACFQRSLSCSLGGR